MSYLQQLISNSVLITALIGWFAAQVLKMILVWDKKKFDFKRIIGSGGMPSSHSSFVMALTMSLRKALTVWLLQYRRLCRLWLCMMRQASEEVQVSRLLYLINWLSLL